MCIDVLTAIQLPNGFHGGIPTTKHNSNIPALLASLCRNPPSKLLVIETNSQSHHRTRLDHHLHALQHQPHGRLDLLLRHRKHTSYLARVRDNLPVPQAHRRAQTISNRQRLDGRNPLASLQTLSTVIRAFEARLCAEYPRRRLIREERSHAGVEATPADGRDHGIESLAGVLDYIPILLLELQSRRALPADDVEIVVRRHEDGVCFGLDVADYCFALYARRAAEHYLCAVGVGAGDLGWRADTGHDDVGGDVESARGEGEGLGVVSCDI